MLTYNVMANGPRMRLLLLLLLHVLIHGAHILWGVHVLMGKRAHVRVHLVGVLLLLLLVLQLLLLLLRQLIISGRGREEGQLLLRATASIDGDCTGWDATTERGVYMGRCWWSVIESMVREQNESKNGS